MTTKIQIENGRLRCTDGKMRSVDNCRFCVHSRKFIIAGKEEKSPALAYCVRERVTKSVAYEKAEAVICAEERGDGFSSIGNIIA